MNLILRDSLSQLSRYLESTNHHLCGRGVGGESLSQKDSAAESDAVWVCGFEETHRSR